MEGPVVVTDRSRDSAGGRTLTRRAVLRAAGAATVVAGGVGPGSATRSRREGNSGFPPDGITTYGRTLELGNGGVRPFTSETPSGEPKYHGVEFDREALDGLPDGDDLENSGSEMYIDKYSAGGGALEIHRKWSLEFFAEFPGAVKTPFTFLGVNWNPDGHPGAGGAWEVPHFDIHFHMLETETIDAIEGPTLPPYDEVTARNEDGRPTNIESELADEQLPAGYVRSPPQEAEERYITDMGEHAAPLDAPELPANPDAFTNTLIQGFVGLGSDGQNPELAFVEPMITKEFLENVRGTESDDVPQPAVYPHDQQHPTTYSVRDIPSKDAIAVVIQGFEQV